ARTGRRAAWVAPLPCVRNRRSSPWSRVHACFRGTGALPAVAFKRKSGAVESRPRLQPNVPGIATMADPQGAPLATANRRRKDRRALTVTFEGGESFLLEAEYLRVKSPSAEVQGHAPEERKTVPGKKYVEILEVQPIGNYAVRLVFDDMHSTGIYSWDY